MKGFELAEFSAGEITELLHLLAGLLHLSNVSFMKDEDDILQLEDTASHEALNNASLLLGLQDEKLKVLLQCRCMHLKGDALFTHRNEQQSACARSSLIKFIYSRLFDHIVNRLNDSVAQHLASPEPQEGGSIPASKTIGSKHWPLRHAVPIIHLTLPWTPTPFPSLLVSDVCSYLARCIEFMSSAIIRVHECAYKTLREKDSYI